MTTLEGSPNNEDDPLADLDLDSSTTTATTTVQADTEIDTEMLEKNIFKTIALQDLYGDLVELGKDFYSEVNKYLSLDPEQRYRGRNTYNFRMNLSSFIQFRTERIISHSITFSPVVYEKLAAEEQGLYKRLCNEVTAYRDEIMDKVKESGRDKTA